MKSIAKIISGCQSGADRGAMDAALALGIPTGGWSPKAWFSEDGQIPEKYRLHMKETESYEYPTRTRLNVRDSDATLLFVGRDGLTGGTGLTAKFAVQEKRPIYLAKHVYWINMIGEMADYISDWIDDISELKGMAIVLNVAGPRASKEPEAYERVRLIMEDVIRESNV